jgi:hypothetical protein
MTGAGRRAETNAANDREDDEDKEMQMIADGKGDDKEGGSRRSTIGQNSQCGEWQVERGRERGKKRGIGERKHVGKQEERRCT